MIWNLLAIGLTRLFQHHLTQTHHLGIVPNIHSLALQWKPQTYKYMLSIPTQWRHQLSRSQLFLLVVRRL